MSTVHGGRAQRSLVALVIGYVVAVAVGCAADVVQESELSEEELIGEYSPEESPPSGGTVILERGTDPCPECRLLYSATSPYVRFSSYRLFFDLVSRTGASAIELYASPTVSGDPAPVSSSGVPTVPRVGVISLVNVPGGVLETSPQLTYPGGTFPSGRDVPSTTTYWVRYVCSSVPPAGSACASSPGGSCWWRLRETREGTWTIPTNTYDPRRITLPIFPIYVAW
jgi:hypothetical protein